MNNPEKERFKKICYNTNYNKEFDCSGLKKDADGNAITKPMTKKQQLRVYKSLKIDPPAFLLSTGKKINRQMKLIKRKAGNE